MTSSKRIQRLSSWKLAECLRSKIGQQQIMINIFGESEIFIQSKPLLRGDNAFGHKNYATMN